MTIEDIKQELQYFKDDIYSQAAEKGTTPKVYIHWTGGRYKQDFGDYHSCVHGDGTIVKTLDFDVRPSATWRRNSGSIAIALDCCYNATPDNLGDYPPTDAQIEAVSMLVAAVCKTLDMEINDENVMTHAEVADIDGYGIHSGDPDLRWDLLFLQDGDAWWSGGDIIRGKAIYYLENGEV